MNKNEEGFIGLQTTNLKMEAMTLNQKRFILACIRVKLLNMKITKNALGLRKQAGSNDTTNRGKATQMAGKFFFKNFSMGGVSNMHAMLL